MDGLSGVAGRNALLHVVYLWENAVDDVIVKGAQDKAWT